MLEYFHKINENTKNECHICLDFKNKKNLIVLSCNHSFHATCLYDWFDKKNICPICMSEKYIIYSTISRRSYNKKKEKMKKNCCVIL